MTMNLRLPALLALALPLAACISFGAKPPSSLMTLTAATPLAVGPARAIDPLRAVQVGVPTVPQALVGVRVPVQSSSTAISYVKDAQWAESPNRLFRNLMAEVIAARTGRPVLDPRQFGIAPGVRLGGGLKAFGLDATTGMAVVTFDATLARGERAVEARRFEARVPATIDPVGAASGLNQAANQVAVEVADWIGS